MSHAQRLKLVVVSSVIGYLEMTLIKHSRIHHNLPDDWAMASWQDRDFFRPLHVLLTYGPMALLGPRLNLGKNPTVDLPLHKLFAATWHPSPTPVSDAILCQLNLWKVIVNMVQHGHGAFVEGIDGLVKSWSSLAQCTPSSDRPCVWTEASWNRCCQNVKQATHYKLTKFIRANVMDTSCLKPMFNAALGHRILDALEDIVSRSSEYIESGANPNMEGKNAVEIRSTDNTNGSNNGDRPVDSDHYWDPEVNNLEKEADASKDENEESERSENEEDESMEDESREDESREGGYRENETEEDGAEDKQIRGKGKNTNGEKAKQKPSKRKRDNSDTGDGKGRKQKRRKRKKSTKSKPRSNNKNKGSDPIDVTSPFVASLIHSASTLYAQPVLRPSPLTVKSIENLHVVYPMVSEDDSSQITWAEADISIKKFNNMEADHEQLREVFIRSLPGNKVQDIPNKVITISRQTWDGMDEDDQRDLFRSGSIHVVGSSDQRIFPKVKEWKDFRHTKLDLTMQRHVHDLTSSRLVSKRMKRATILKFLKAQESGKEQVVNYLDIDFTGIRVNIPTAELEDLANSFGKDAVWYTPWPARHLCWGLLGNKGTITQNHMDACGTCTHVRVILGSKLWFIALDEKLPDTNGFSNNVSWQQIFLQPGDDLYMRPATRHFVFGTEDTFIVGGHFYSRTCFSRTLDAITMEHYLGESLTNADHSYSAIILFKLLQSYEKALIMDRTSEEAFPNKEELASLLLLIFYLEQLWPQTEEKFATYRWHWTHDFEHDYSTVVRIAYSVASKMGVRDKNFSNCVRDREQEFISLCNQLEEGQPDATLTVSPMEFWKEFFGDDQASDTESPRAESLNPLSDSEDEITASEDVERQPTSDDWEESPELGVANPNDDTSHFSN
jgi:hypothetical protein